MLFKMDMSLFLYLVVGSLGMDLYSCLSSSSWAFLIYSSLSITTKDTPFSAVKMILLLSFLSSAKALLSCMVMFDMGGCIFSKMVLISPLSSSASPCLSCDHACSMEAMYSPTGGDLGTMAKLGPCDKIFSCASVRGVLEMFLSHMLLLLLLLVTSPFASVWTVLMVSVLFLCSDLLFTSVWSWLPCCMFEQLPSFFLFFWHNLSNLSFCCCRVLKCLDSLFSLINPVYSSMLSLSNVFF